MGRVGGWWMDLLYDVRAGLDDLVPEDVRVRRGLLVVALGGTAVVHQAALVLVLLGVEDKVAACGVGAGLYG